MDGTCFYCLQKIGEEHLSSCVLIQKKAMVKMTVAYEIKVPNSWDEDLIDFHRNEGSWCHSNALEELKELEKEHRCLCGDIDFEVVEIGTTPFLDE